MKQYSNDVMKKQIQVQLIVEFEKLIEIGDITLAKSKSIAVKTKFEIFTFIYFSKVAHI